MAQAGKTQKIDLNTRIGERFEPIPITPHEMVKSLDSDSSKINGLVLDGATYKLSDRFYKTLAAELGIPYGVFGFFTPHSPLTSDKLNTSWSPLEPNPSLPTMFLR